MNFKKRIARIIHRMIRNHTLKIILLRQQLEFLVILMNRVSYELHYAVSNKLFAERTAFHRSGHDAAAAVTDNSLSGCLRFFRAKLWVTQEQYIAAAVWIIFKRSKIRAFVPVLFVRNFTKLPQKMLVAAADIFGKNLPKKLQQLYPPAVFRNRKKQRFILLF